jgi:hypothetical protein
MWRIRIYLLSAFLLFGVRPILWAQVSDSARIAPIQARQPSDSATAAPLARILTYADSNSAQTYIGEYHTYISAGTSNNFKRQTRLQANTSAYLAFSLSYKWLTIAYQFNLPQTSVFRGPEDHTVKASSLSLSHWWNNWGIEASYQHDRGMILQQFTSGPHPINYIWQGVDYKYVGINLDYVFSPNRFSFKAANNFSRRQTQSGGSWMFQLTPAYQNFSITHAMLDTASKDTTLYNLVNKNANHLMILARFGYAYNFVWDKGQWSVSPMAIIGPGGGLYLDQLHDKQKVFPMLGCQGRLTGGYNGHKWYVYLNALYDLSQEPQKNLGLKTVNETTSISVGYRFPHLRHKIWKVL